MHVPSGLFVQGQYQTVDFDSPGNPGNSSYWGDYAGHTDSHAWQVQAGIAKNWTGLGNTSLYGEYSRLTDWGAGVGLGKDWTNAGAGFDDLNGVTDSVVKVWGLGIVQKVDAAATELYLGWRHYSFDITCTGAGPVGDCSGAAGASPTKLDVEDIDVVAGGARVKF